VLGFATYAQFRGGVGYAKTMEHTIILSPALNGMGVGRRIMQTLCDHAKDRGVMSMFAGVSARNDAGVQFHRAVGFQPVARLEKVGFKFGQFIDLVLMQKFL
jgi:phosphinothricin acetyltransferase